jgi:hypothetical protein
LCQYVADSVNGSLNETINKIQRSGGHSASDTVQSTVESQDKVDGSVANIDRDEAITMINNLSFFDKFSVFEKRRMIALFTSFRTYPANSEILLEGMSDSAFFIPITGEVQVHKGGTVFVTLGAGEFFGGLAHMLDEPRITNVRSKTDVLVLRLDPKLFAKLGPEIREKIKDQFIYKLTSRLVKIKEAISAA